MWSLSICLLLVLTSFITLDLVLDITPRVEGITHYVGGGGIGNYSTIQEGIDAAGEGDTIFVFNGTYFENVIINKTINLTGEDRDNTVIDGDQNADVIYLTADWVNIIGFTIQNSGNGSSMAGIKIVGGNNCQINYNNVSLNADGIYLSLSNDNIISNNTVSGNGDNGIYLITSNNNIFKNNTVLANGYDGIYLLNSASNTMDNNNVSLNSEDGIDLDRSDNNILRNNIISENENNGIYLGIPMSSSKYAIIRNNTIFGNDRGIYVRYSDGNEISFNNISWNTVNGISLSSSNDNIITNNIMYGNGIYIYGSAVENWNSHTIDITNSVNDKPLYYWKDKNGGTIPPNAGQVILANCDDIIVKDQNVSLGSVGISLGHSNGIIIENNNASENTMYGLWLYRSDYNLIANNTASSNKGIGIFLTLVDNSIIVNNTASWNGNDGFRIGYSGGNMVDNNSMSSNSISGIYLEYSGYCDLSNNIMKNNGIFIYSPLLYNWNSNNIYDSNKVNGKPVYYWKNKTGGVVPPGAGQVILANCSDVRVENQNVSDGTAGILVGQSQDIMITNNIASNNHWGIYLYSTSDINISNNTIDSNRLWGIFFWETTNSISNGNTISNNFWGVYLFNGAKNYLFYQNNMINNTNQATMSLANSWNVSYPMGGNYWSDYPGVDEFSGPNQDVPGSDGIGDTAFEFNLFSYDNYPLMEPYTYKPLENYTILKQGWNLISLPLIQENQSLIKVLEMIDGYYDAVQWYDPGDLNDPWKHYKVGKPLGNDLGHLNQTMGFWIHITNPGDTIFLYNGTQPIENQTIPLHLGWNMVGYPSLTNYNRTQGLNNLEFGADVDAIQWFDSATKTWHFMDPEDNFVMGRGYWLHSKVDTVWEVSL
jgi:parallel beta-helix repeat protein